MAQGDDDSRAGERARRRQRGFVLHLIGYFAVVAVMVSINLLFSPGNPWVVLPMVGWGGVLAVHAAIVMGLFG